jgi:predicted oxidoreductase
MKFSKIIAGCMHYGSWGANFTTAQYQQHIEACAELGITTFDHADIYGNYTTEADFGKAFTHYQNQRQQFKIITKCGIQLITNQRPNNKVKHYNTSYSHIIASAEQSLQNLQTDYLDALLIHRPTPLMQLDEIAKAFTKLQEQGKVLAFGVSNFTATQMQLLHQIFPIITNQLEISVLAHDAFFDDTLNLCAANNIKPTAWSPLGGTKFFKQDSTIKQHLTHTAAAYDTNVEALMLAWLLQHPAGITPILGTTKPERLAAALDAFNIDLETQDWYEILQTARGEDVA